VGRRASRLAVSGGTSPTPHDSSTSETCRAVDDAVAKAQAYSDAVGRGPVRAIQLADPDMLATGPQARSMPMMATAAPDAASTLELRPEDIQIAVAVDARFVAG